MKEDDPDRPRVTTRNVLLAVAFLAVAALVIVPLGLCSSFLVVGPAMYDLLRGKPYADEIATAVACIPVLVIVGFLIRHATRIAKGE